jgi:hypothetical protein
MKWNAEWYIVVRRRDIMKLKNYFTVSEEYIICYPVMPKKKSTWIYRLRRGNGPQSTSCTHSAPINHPSCQIMAVSGLTWSCFCSSFRTRWRETQHRRWTERVWGFSLHHPPHEGTYQYTYFTITSRSVRHTVSEPVVLHDCNCKCVVAVSIIVQQDATIFSILYFCKPALHVSGGISTHN